MARSPAGSPCCLQGARPVPPQRWHARGAQPHRGRGRHRRPVRRPSEWAVSWPVNGGQPPAASPRSSAAVVRPGCEWPVNGRCVTFSRLSPPDSSASRQPRRSGEAALRDGVSAAVGVVQLFCVRCTGSPPVQVAASPPAVGFRPQAPLQLHQAPHPGAVRTDVGLDVGSELTDGGQVDAEQLRAPLQRRRDRPAQIRVVPGPHRSRLPEQMFEIQSTQARGGTPASSVRVQPTGRRRQAGTGSPG
jgi:hypothetical protein